MFYVQCGFDFNIRRYGPFGSEPVANLWLEAHAPTESFAGLHSVCDEYIHRHQHTIVSLIDPMKGISKRAEVDVTHALSGE